MSYTREYQYETEEIPLSWGGRIEIEADYGEVPRVQIPLGTDQPGLTIDGEFVNIWTFPAEARDAYERRFSNKTKHRVYQCDECGYLTTAESAKPTAYNKYQCNNSYDEITTSHNGTTAGQWGAHRSWRIDLQVNGDDKVAVDDTTDLSYTLTVCERDRYHADAEVLAETTVEIPDTDTTLTGETNGKRWEADVGHYDNGTVRVVWRRVTADGDPVTYSYKEAERGPDREHVGVNVGDEYADRDGYATTGLATESRSYRRERECGSTEFTKVYPNRYSDGDEMDIMALDADDVPNAKSHLSRIQNQIDASITQREMLQRVARAFADADIEVGDDA